jgi:integrase
MAQIKDLVFKNGERYPMLMDDRGFPDYWVTLYVTEKLRPSLTQSAITNTIGHLVHLRLWEQVNNRNLLNEFSNNELLKVEDVYSIRDHCMLDSRSFKKWIKSSSKKIVKFPLASTSTIAPLQTVSKIHASNRMTHIANFLDFKIRALLKAQLVDRATTEAIKSMNKALLKNKPKGVKGVGLSRDPNSKAPSSKAFERILKIVKEDSPDNPFKGIEIRYRNALIFEVMSDTGMRAGEILALQIGDIDFFKPAITVIRRHDAIEDPRKKQPVAKTCERRIPVSKSLTDRLRSYILGDRANAGLAKKHPYIFVTHKHGKYFGNPISNSTFVNRVLKPAIAVSPELLEEITRHGFRHYFNYKLSKRIDAINKAAKTNPEIKPINETMEKQLRKELNGWISDGTAETYNLRHVKEEADRVMREDLEHWSKFLNRGE